MDTKFTYKKLISLGSIVALAGFVMSGPVAGDLNYFQKFQFYK